MNDCWEGDNNVSLPDLRTEDADVQNGFNSWISSLIPNYGIDGVRLDSVLQVNTGFWQSFVTAAGSPYMVGEIFQNSASFVCNYQNYIPGVMNYGT